MGDERVDAMEDAGRDHAQAIEGVPAALRGLHGRQMAAIRRSRRAARGQTDSELWGPGSQRTETPDQGATSS